MKKISTGNPLATLLYIFLVCTVSMFIITACRKTDNVAKPETPEGVMSPEKFFSAHPSTNPAVMGAQKFLKNQNDKYRFTEEFINRIGMPFWNKALVYTNTANTTIGTESTGGPSTVVYIPFVRDSQNYVNASVLIKMTGTDTSYRIICDWQYSEFGFEHSDTSWSARDIFAIFSILDKSVFGHKKYRIKDGRIFGYPKETQLIATEVPQAGRVGIESFELQCTPRTVCITAPPSSNRSITTETVCTITAYTCTLVWTGGGGPGPLPPGGGGGGSGTGPGSGGPVLPPNPCPVLPRGGYTVETVSNPCDTTTWAPIVVSVDSVINNLISPCFLQFLNAIADSKLKSEIIKLYEATYVGTNKVHNIRFEEVPNLVNPLTGLPEFALSSRSASSPNTWLIYLNSNAQNFGTSQLWGSFILHEIVHGFIRMNELNFNLGSNFSVEHQTMLTSWVSQIRDALVEIYNMNTDDALALALQGMDDILTDETTGQFRQQAINYVQNLYQMNLNVAATLAEGYATKTKGTICQ